MPEKINEEQIKTVWKKYADNDFKIKTASGEVWDSKEFDEARRKHLETLKKLVKEFLEEKKDLATFKSDIDGENKRNNYWGFDGYNGQMFFNMLYNRSEEDDELAELLRDVIREPDNESEIEGKITKLGGYVERIRTNIEDLRRAPRPGSIPFFLSYFWHIQNPEKYPIYYTSTVNVLSDLAIWEPEGNLSQKYIDFRRLFSNLEEIMNEVAEEEIGLWTVEHAFWYWSRKDEFESEKTVDKELATIPDSYIPPIVSIIPDLAGHSEELDELVGKTDKSVENLLENRLVKYFEILGFKVENLGQGSGRNPDGVVKNHEYRYAIIYDAKSRKDGYSINTADERQFEDYMHQWVPKLKGQGFRNVYFAVISGNFNDESRDTLKSLKIRTDIQEIILVEADALTELLEQFLRDPELNLGPGNREGAGVQDIFAESRVLKTSDVREELGI